MSGKRILIVDDSPIILRALSLKLKSEGYQPLTAADGGEAVSLVRREKPDLILLDIGFPPDVAHGGGVPWDGFLIMQWLQRMDEASRIPVIVITGGDPAKLKDRSLAAGAVAFFRKPIDNEELLAVIRKTLGESEEPPVAPPEPPPPAPPIHEPPGLA
jgi:two-component system KDP operon response regulator KdpE